MKSSKERKMDRKRKHKALGAARTVKSRQRRLDNKAKRTEIISINSHAKIDIIDQETYVDGVKVEVIDNRIVPVSLEPEVVVAADEGEVNVIEKIETHMLFFLTYPFK
jgi:hypothetical protein